MNGSYLIAIAFCCAVGPALLWLWNMLLYREPGATSSCSAMGNCELPDCISALIPGAQ